MKVSENVRELERENDELLDQVHELRSEVTDLQEQLVRLEDDWDAISRDFEKQGRILAWEVGKGCSRTDCKERERA